MSFTLVFDGDIRAFKGNPVRTETPFGVPRAASGGDALTRLDGVLDVLTVLYEAYGVPKEMESRVQSAIAKATGGQDAT